MNEYYTERNYTDNTDYSNNYSLKKLNQNYLFRNFLVSENVEGSKKKFFASKQKEILPSYTNIRDTIENGRKEIKSKFNIENSLFKEIQARDLVIYSQFAKNISEYFFGPFGIITEKNINLKKYHSQKNKKKKEELDNRIYAGRWLYLDENPKYVRFIARLKNNRKKLLNIGGNFSTEDDFRQKLHDVFLKYSRKKKQKKENEEKTPEKNIFEFTTIDKPFNKRKNSISPKKYLDKTKLNNLILNTTPNFFGRNKYNYINEKEKNKTMFNVKSFRKKIKIKNIFQRERFFEKENRNKKKYFSNLKLTINTKINAIESPIKNMNEQIYSIKKNNKTIDTIEEENKERYKEDMQVIGEDNQKETDDFMNKFLKKTYRMHLRGRNNTIPKKIFFTYYEQGGNTARQSLKKFLGDIEKIKEIERKIKYGKSTREQFKNNFNLIKKLGRELEDLKVKSKNLFKEKN